jgi:hypothetical protein
MQRRSNEATGFSVLVTSSPRHFVTGRFPYAARRSARNCFAMNALTIS